MRGHYQCWVGLLLVSVLGCLGLAAPRSALAEAPPRSVADIVASVLPAVVAISATEAMSPGPGPNAVPPHVEQVSGSGFIIDPSGLIVTNKHVIEGTVAIAVTLQDGTIMSAEFASESTRTDIALLRVFPDRPLHAVRFGNSDALRVGDAVIAVGSPLGFEGTVTSGIVSGLNRNIMETPFDDYIQTDASINHGNSGGPLFDLNGEVIGMNSVIFAPGRYGGSIGLGFAIPSNDVQFVTDQLRRYGRVEPGWIGLRFQQVTPQLQMSLGLTHEGGGAIVVSVVPDSPAASAGMRSGDVVLGFNGLDIHDARALARAIARAPIGKDASMSIWRNSVALNLDIAVMRAPDNATGQNPNGQDRLAGNTAGAPIPLGLALSAIPGSARMSYGLPPDQHGVLVTGMAPDGAAAKAGLKTGDVIVMLRQYDVDSPASVLHYLREVRDEGRQFAAMLVTRGGQARWVAMYVPPDLGPQTSAEACDGLPGPACQVTAAASQEAQANPSVVSVPLRPRAAPTSN